MELEIIDEYIIEGDHRYRIKVKGTKIILNISAKNSEEALEKAKKLFEKIRSNLPIEK